MLYALGLNGPSIILKVQFSLLKIKLIEPVSISLRPRYMPSYQRIAPRSSCFMLLIRW